MATTYDFTDGSITGQMQPVAVTVIENRVTIMRNIVDCSKQTLTASASDVAKALNIPAGTTVLTSWMRVITAETSGAKASLGYAGGTQFASAVAVSATGAVGGSFAPAYFSAADTIDIIADATAAVDLDGLKVEVCALCLRSRDTY